MRPPATVLFGSGTVAAVGDLAAGIGRRALVCTDGFLATAPQTSAVVAALRAAGVEVEVLDAALPELPKGSVADAVEAARRARPDCIVGLGGGSCLDLAKLVAIGVGSDQPLEQLYGEHAVPGPGLPVLAVPTTAGTGSEVTPVAVLSDPDRHLKVGISSPHLVARAAICDPDLTHGAPPAVTAYAGIDALAHAIEAYCAIARPTWGDAARRVFVGRNVLSDRFALHAIERIGGALRAAVDDDPVARADMLEGSLNAGLAFATAGTALAHALQYPVGARTGTPHGLGVGTLLPYVMAFNTAAVPGRLGDVARALGAGDDAAAAVGAVRELAASVGVPAALGELGVTVSDLGEIADQALGIERLIGNNPRPVGRSELDAVLAAAMSGDPMPLIAA
jgi:alcohol dehydrogenase